MPLISYYLDPPYRRSLSQELTHPRDLALGLPLFVRLWVDSAPSEPNMMVLFSPLFCLVVGLAIILTQHSLLALVVGLAIFLGSVPYLLVTIRREAELTLRLRRAMEEAG